MSTKRDLKDHSPLGFLLRRKLLLESETSWFLLLSGLDLVLTAVLLSTGTVRETNPMARFFLLAGGVRGLVGFKCMILTLVTVSVQIIALRHPRVAKAVLQLGIVVQFLVVCYSAALLAKVVS